jgi:hypothetical protein
MKINNSIYVPYLEDFLLEYVQTIMGTKNMKTNEERISQNLNSKHETNEQRK